METITASAININWAIIVWKRHCDCIKSAVESWIWEAPIRSSEQWFYTSEFRYVDRYEWAKIAFMSKQIKEPKIDFLYSEDLR